MTTEPRPAAHFFPLPFALPAVRSSSGLLPRPLRLMLRLRARGMARRAVASLCSPRRLMLSVLAVILAGVWLGNAVISMLFREPYAPETFRLGLLMSLVGYGLWPVLKASWKRPAEAIDWSSAEKEFLVGGPFHRRDLIDYRLCVILTATVLKGLAVTVLLLADLGCWWLGLLGTLLVLTVLELTRLTAEIVFWGLPGRWYNVVRAVTAVAVGGLGLYCLTGAVCGLPQGASAGPAAFVLMQGFFAEIKALFSAPLGSAAAAPLAPFISLMTAERFTADVALDLCIAVLTLAALYLALMETDRLAAAWQNGLAASGLRRDRLSVFRQKAAEAFRLPRVRHLAGAGPIAWRQWVGTRRYPASLAVSLLIPGALSCAPLMLRLPPIESFVNVAGSLAFYSFLLLPSALKFDFRRDCDRLAILKTLPLSPGSVVAGQLAIPVGLTLLVQVCVLLVAFLVRPVPLPLLLGALALMVPVNVVIYGMENLLFLLFPHRLNEEGIQIFLRSILLFTAKGILLAAALTAVFLWAISCRLVTAALRPSGLVDHRVVFVGGLWLIAAGSAALLVHLLARQFARFDPSLDLPG